MEGESPAATWGRSRAPSSPRPLGLSLCPRGGGSSEIRREWGCACHGPSPGERWVSASFPSAQKEVGGGTAQETQCTGDVLVSSGQQFQPPLPTLWPKTPQLT